MPPGLQACYIRLNKAGTMVVVLLNLITIKHPVSSNIFIFYFIFNFIQVPGLVP